MKDYGDMYGTGRCLNATGEVHSNGSWGNLSFLELSFKSCLEPTAQFRFRENGAMLNLERQGCLAGDYATGPGYYYTDMFFLYVDSVSLDNAACAQNPSKGIYRAVKQTADGGLYVYYKGKHRSSFQTWCAEPRYNDFEKKHYISLSTPCYFHTLFDWNSNFCFGEFLNIFIYS